MLGGVSQTFGRVAGADGSLDAEYTEHTDEHGWMHTRMHPRSSVPSAYLEGSLDAEHAEYADEHGSMNTSMYPRYSAPSVSSAYIRSNTSDRVWSEEVR